MNANKIAQAKVAAEERRIKRRVKAHFQAQRSAEYYHPLNQIAAAQKDAGK